MTREDIKPGMYLSVDNELYKVGNLYPRHFTVTLLYPKPIRTMVTRIEWDRLEMVAFAHPTDALVKRAEKAYRRTA